MKKDYQALSVASSDEAQKIYGAVMDRTPELDKHFGTKTSTVATMKRTEFPRVPPGAREYCDEWLQNIRALYEQPDYYPDKMDKATWRAESEKLFNGRGYYRPGFLTWALQEHIKRFKAQGKIPVFKGPLSVNYLWHQYDGQLVAPYGSEEYRQSYVEGWQGRKVNHD